MARDIVFELAAANHCVFSLLHVPIFGQLRCPNSFAQTHGAFINALTAMDYIDEILITFVGPQWSRQEKETKRQIVVDFFSAHLIRALTYISARRSSHCKSVSEVCFSCSVGKFIQTALNSKWNVVSKWDALSVVGTGKHETIRRMPFSVGSFVERTFVRARRRSRSILTIPFPFHTFGPTAAKRKHNFCSTSESELRLVGLTCATTQRKVVAQTFIFHLQLRGSALRTSAQPVH